MALISMGKRNLPSILRSLGGIKFPTGIDMVGCLYCICEWVPISNAQRSVELMHRSTAGGETVIESVFHHHDMERIH